MATIVTRSGKGSPLTHAEVDANFTNLNTDKLELSGGTMTGNLSFGDNDKAIFGAGSDLQIYHDGNNSYISDQGTGNLKLLAENFVLKTPDDATNAIFADTDASVYLYHAGSQKLVTTSTGVDITGTLTSDGLTVDGNASLSGTSPHLTFYETDLADTNTRILTQTRKFRIGTVTDAGGSFTERFQIDHNTGDISFYEDTGTTPKFFWDASAESLGIGTSSPQRELHILSPTSSSGAQIRLENGEGYAEINADNNTMSMYVGGTSGITLDSSGNVGIGTSSPSKSLHILNASATGSTNPSHLRIEGNNSNYYDIGRDNSGTGFLSFYGSQTSATGYIFGGVDGERMRIDSSGNVGIGATPQSHYTGYTALDLGASGSIWSNRTTSDTNTIMMANNAYLNSGATSWLRIHADEATRYEQGGGVHRWAYAASGAAGSSISWSEAMRIDSSGRVGIGTSSPSTTLEVNGGTGNEPIKVTSTDAGSYIRFADDSTTGSTRLGAVGNEFKIDVNSSEAMRIDSSGNVGIGLTPSSGNGVLQIAGGLRIAGSALASDTTAPYIFRTSGVNNMVFATNAAERMRIDSSGNLLVGTTVYSGASSPQNSSSSADAGTVIEAGGTVQIGRYQNSPLRLNRMSTDGAIAEFRKDGTTVGSIGVDSGDLTVGNLSGHTGIRFATNALLPTDSGTISDGTESLGSDTYRWNNLYLSGGVYLGGTGSANKLDDYESGTWTPALKIGGSTTGITYNAQEGVYIKVGQQVFVNFRLSLTNKGSSTGTAVVTGLPFSVADSFTGISFEYGGVWDNWNDLAVATTPRWYLNQPDGDIVLLNEHTTAGDTSWGDRFSQADITDTTDIRISFTYKST